MSYKRSRAAAFESDHAQSPPHHAPFTLYGTPLPAFDPDARDDGSYVPLWKQEVTDERGRKRLHGAFTGGFSAGYFNTVGSKEGWTPSAFVSSRSNRAKDSEPGTQRGQRPEDFMDDEDRAEQAESQQLQTQHAFAGLGNAGDVASGGKGMFSDLFKTTGDTKGMKLLQRMGWRPGQGIGPKVRRRAQGDSTGEKHFFAPQNTRMIGFAKKTDRKGLGFAGEDRLQDAWGTSSKNGGHGGDNEEDDSNDESHTDSRIFRTNRSKALTKSKPLKKSGFGVGVLNDDGSDDEDPYAMGPRISYSRIIGADKRKKKGDLVASTANPSVVKPIFTSKKLGKRASTTSSFRKCHDGHLPLDGFILATATLTVSDESEYAVPQVPPEWKPSKQVTASSTRRDSSAYQSPADAAKASTLDAKARAALLGEQQLPGKSIFDFLKPDARDRLAAATGKTDLPPALGEGAPVGIKPSKADQRRTLWDLVPPLDRQTAAAALQRGRTGWMPYGEDDAKRARYISFLELHAGLRSATALPERPKPFSTVEWAQELREFADAAEIFKPASGLIASRFTSSTSAGPKLASDAPPSSAPEDRSDDPAEKAAKLGMYGPLTRSRLPFYPTRLLCKRFNVKPPPNVAAGSAAEADADNGGSGGTTDAGSHRLDLVSQASLDRMMMEASYRPPSFVSGGHEGGSTPSATAAAAAAVPALSSLPSRVLRPAPIVDVEKNEALEGQRAGEEVFKAIFGSDDEDD